MPQTIAYARVSYSAKLKEYIVWAYDASGHHMPHADYSTDNRLDAYLTRVAMLYPSLYLDYTYMPGVIAQAITGHMPAWPAHRANMACASRQSMSANL